MAKRFLENLQTPLEDDFLGDLIPGRREKTAAPAKTKKKQFKAALEKAVEPETARRISRKKSFLGSIEAALQDNAFDEVIPLSKPYRPKDPEQDTALKQSAFSLMIPQDALDRARQIALAKGIRLSDVLNIALQYYLKNVAT